MAIFMKALMFAFFLFATSWDVQAQEFLLTGIHKEYYSNGSVRSIAQYKDGKLEGYVREYHPNGQLAFVQDIEHGKINGPVKAYYPSGQIQGETMYVNNFEDGPMREYYENGTIKEEALYVRGQIIQLRSFDIDGKLMSHRENNFSAGCVVTKESQEDL